MKSILSLLVLAMAVLFMGCGEPATSDAGPDALTATSPEEGAKCSCCTECEKCEDGEKCECTAEAGEKCDCKCADKDSDEMAAAEGDDEEGHDHEDGDSHE